MAVCLSAATMSGTRRSRSCSSCAVMAGFCSLTAKTLGMNSALPLGGISCGRIRSHVRYGTTTEGRNR